MKISKLLVPVFSIFLFTACSSDDDSSSFSPSLSVENLPTLNLSFTADGGESYVIAVKTNQSSWDVESDKGWCIVEKTGDNEFTVTALSNTFPQSPEPATITITAGDAQPVKIKVTQSGFGAELSINPSSPIEFSAKDDKSVEITVITNQAYWDAVADASWCVVTKGNDDKFTVSVQENTSKDKRKANIIVSAPNTADIAILVEQKGAETGGNGGGGGGANGSLQITLEDARKHRVLKTVSYTYSGTDIGKQLNPGDAGKGVTWDFSGIDLSKYNTKIKQEKEGRVENYSTSPYKNYYPDATECYVTRELNTHPDNNNELVGYYDVYDYVKGNIEYGNVQDNTLSGGGIDIWNYIPTEAKPYPQYLGVKYKIETSHLNVSGHSYDYHADTEIDGEGTIILPGGKKFTDVLRYRIIDNNGQEQYNYISKQAGVVLTFVKYANIITFTTE
ncbi:MAG: BACON domain-containing protein [Flavobacteriaceae bacterium]|jgi:hypothetical protein|nr:BACON domain-containing protein [Flavobacteriaceae bacterium]